MLSTSGHTFITAVCGIADRRFIHEICTFLNNNPTERVLNDVVIAGTFTLPVVDMINAVVIAIPTHLAYSNTESLSWIPSPEYKRYFARLCRRIGVTKKIGLDIDKRLRIKQAHGARWIISRSKSESALMAFIVEQDYFEQTRLGCEKSTTPVLFNLRRGYLGMKILVSRLKMDIEKEEKERLEWFIGSELIIHNFNHLGFPN
jgi:hypothetical protein